jgi:hypothetical protein
MKSLERILIVLFFLMPFSGKIFAQGDTIYIEKKECTSEGIYKGYKLIIHYKNDTVNTKAKMYDYHLDFLKGINDKIKLDVIGMLLNYQDDTSMCCLKVQYYSFNGNEGCRGKVENIDRYTIQVDALFIINRLVWPKLMELYSCSPVLYDKKRKKGINSDQKKIKIVFAAYKKWYAECKAKGRIPRYFPFNDGRYIWDGGRKSITPKE